MSWRNLMFCTGDNELHYTGTSGSCQICDDLNNQKSGFSYDSQPSTVLRDLKSRFMFQPQSKIIDEVAKHEETIRKLRQEIMSLSNQVSQLTNENSNIKLDNKQTESLERYVFGLQEEIAMHQEKNCNNLGQIDALLRDKEVLAEQLQLYESTSIISEHRNLKIDNDELSKRVVVLEVEINNLSKELVDTEIEVYEKVNNIRALNDEIADLQNHVNSLSNVNYHDVENNLEELNNKITDLQKENIDLSSDLIDKEIIFDENKSLKETIDELKLYTSELQEKIWSKEVEMNKYCTSEVITQREEIDKLKKRNSELEFEINNYWISELENKNSVVIQKEELDRLRNRNIELESQLNDYNSPNVNLEKVHTLLNKQFEEVKEERDCVLSDLGVTEQEKLVLEKELNQTQDNYKLLNNQYQGIKFERDCLLTNLNDIMQENSELESDLEQVSEKCESLTKKFSHLQLNNETAQEKNRKLSNKIDKVISENTTLIFQNKRLVEESQKESNLDDALKETTYIIAVLNEKIKDLEYSLDKHISENKKLTNLIMDIQLNNDILREDNMKLKQNMAQISQVDCVEENRLRSIIDTITDQHNKTKSELIEANKQKELLNNQLSQIKKKVISGVFI